MRVQGRIVDLWYIQSVFVNEIGSDYEMGCRIGRESRALCSIIMQDGEDK